VEITCRPGTLRGEAVPRRRPIDSAIALDRLVGRLGAVADVVVEHLLVERKVSLTVPCAREGVAVVGERGGREGQYGGKDRHGDGLTHDPIRQ
jgi:hypothetical protein